MNLFVFALYSNHPNIERIILERQDVYKDELQEIVQSPSNDDRPLTYPEPTYPAGWGKPSFMAGVRRNNGWFGGAHEAPSVPRDAGVITLLASRSTSPPSPAPGFFGPNSWFMNDPANIAYALQAKYGGALTTGRRKWPGLDATIRNASSNEVTMTIVIESLIKHFKPTCLLELERAFSIVSLSLCNGYSWRRQTTGRSLQVVSRYETTRESRSHSSSSDTHRL